MKKKVVKTKDITNLEILESVNRSFSSLENRFDKVESRLDKVESQLGAVEKDIEILNQSMQATRRDVLNIGDKFITQHTFNDLALRVVKLEKKK
jgi:predicted  nucleic acid-binding Zn-ribbon protein